MKKLSDVTAMVVDFGQFFEIARVLGRAMKKVYLCNPSWVGGFPKINEARIGTGFPEIEVCYSPFHNYEDIDLFCFFDIGHGEWQQQLVADGKAVWGCRMAEDLEFERPLIKKIMEKKGLPVGPYEIIKGIDTLRIYLKEHKEQHVKISKWRGHFETFKSKNYNLIESKLDLIEWQLGGFKNDVEFISEDALKDMYEGAVDTHNVDGVLPATMLYGIEDKGRDYIGKFASYDKEIPDVFKAFDEKMAPVLERYEYKSFYSPETRVGKDRKGYMIDLCCRAPSPANELYQVFYTNLADIIWQGANGICIDPIPADKWGVQIQMHAPHAAENDYEIQFPKSMAHLVKLRNAIKKNGRFHIMPQEGRVTTVGAVVGYGPTLAAAKEMAIEVKDSVEGYGLEFPDEPFKKAEAQIEKAKEFDCWLKGDNGK